VSAATTGNPPADVRVAGPGGKARIHPTPLILAAVLAALAAVLVVHVSPWVTEGFGVSHDGYNASMWGLGARAAWDEPVASRLGGIQPDGYHYANHPPLLVWMTTLTAGLGGERPFAMRAPALLASVIALGVLARLLLDAGLGRMAVVGGLVLAGTTPMFLTYGAMLDTPVLSLPFGLAAIACAQRAWQGRPPATALAVIVGVSAALTGWQSAAAAGLAGVACLVGTAPTARSLGLRLLAGSAVGGALTVGWIAWVEGSLASLWEQATIRSDGSGAWGTRQRTYLTDLYGWPVLLMAVIGVAVALASRRRVAGEVGGAGGTRRLLAVVGATVVLYTVAFRQASSAHDYWTFWGIALVAIAGACLVEATADALRRGGQLRQVGAATVLVALALVAGLGATRRSDADSAIQDGLRAVPVLNAAPETSDPDMSTLAVRNADVTLAPWAGWATGGHPLRPTAVELARLPPEQLLFVEVVGTPTPDVRAVAVAIDGPYVLLRAGDYQRIVG